MAGRFFFLSVFLFFCRAKAVCLFFCDRAYKVFIFEEQLLWEKVACLYSCEKLWNICDLSLRFPTAILALWQRLSFWPRDLATLPCVCFLYRENDRLSTCHYFFFFFLFSFPRKRVQSWLWCTAGSEPVSSGLTVHRTCGRGRLFTLGAERSVQTLPVLRAFSEPRGRENRSFAERRLGRAAHAHDADPVFVILRDILLSTAQSIEWMLNYVFLFSVYVWEVICGAGGRVRVVKAWSWEWLCNILGWCISWDAFISCMLVAPHTTPNNDGKWDTGVPTTGYIKDMVSIKCTSALGLYNVTTFSL